MIQILESIKLLGLGIASAILFTTISMADISKTKNFIKTIDEVAEEYPEGSIERKILKKRGFVATVSALETGNFQFKGAPTAEKGNNYFGLKPRGDQDFITTTGGVNIASFPDIKSSIRGFANLITTDDRYSEVVKAAEQDEPILNMFKGMTAYAENPNYITLLGNVYNDRIKPIIETENALIPKRKPITEQMDSLQ